MLKSLRRILYFMDFPINWTFYICGFACGCRFTYDTLLHHVCTLAGLLAFHDKMPQNANLNENRKIKSMLSITVVLLEDLLYLTFKPRMSASVQTLLKHERG